MHENDAAPRPHTTHPGELVLVPVLLTETRAFTLTYHTQHIPSLKTIEQCKVERRSSMKKKESSGGASVRNFGAGVSFLDSHSLSSWQCSDCVGEGYLFRQRASQRRGIQCEEGVGEKQ
jgi:hypothetical protein